MKTIRFQDKDIVIDRSGESWSIGYKKDPVYAGIASMKSRKDQLERTLDSLASQVDLIIVYLNDYDEKPEYARKYKNVEFYGPFISDNYKDLGDAGKFFGEQFLNQTMTTGYYFTCDDDLIYPKGYVRYMIDAIEYYERKYIVTLHGRNVPQTMLSITDFYKDTIQHHFSKERQSDMSIHIPGTGVMAYHMNTMHVAQVEVARQYVSIDLGKMADYRNMADVHVGFLAQKNDIGCVLLAHKENYVAQQKVDTSIFTSLDDTDMQCAIVNSTEWRFLSDPDREVVIPSNESVKYSAMRSGTHNGRVFNTGDVLYSNSKLPAWFKRV